MVNGDKLLARTAGIVGSFGGFGSLPENMDAETLALTSCKHIKHVLEVFIKFCYQQTADGFFVNITGNGSIPTGVWCPFGSKGKPKSKTRTRAQLTETERTILREWFKFLATNRRYPLFYYNQSSRRWYVDIMRYSDEVEALAWLEKYTIDAKTFVAIRLRRLGK